MAKRAPFTGLDPYKLAGVRVTDRELGHGSYATVLELEYMGLKCAGKKIHELLLRQGDASYTVRRFEEECRLLSQVRHPNIVQFLGAYFQQGVRVPILVMEFLPTNLTFCIEKYGIFPKEINYSILYDVALGLCYLHSQTPPIIHRDLSSNNVLLTPNMTAKISDLGVARIFNNLTPLQVSSMTQIPGTPAYMPPEVMVADPKYDTSVDEFSYGIMMIHMFSGRWPEPQVGPSRTEPGGKLVPVTEAERREVFLRAIGNDHPIMNLIQKCIKNDPQCRPCAIEILEEITPLNEIPATTLSAIPLEMLKLETEIQQMRDEIDRQMSKNSVEMMECQMQIKKLETNLELQKVEKDTRIAELDENNSQTRDEITRHLQEKRELEARLLSEQKQFLVQLKNERVDLDRTRKQYCDSLEEEKQKFQSQLAEERKKITMKEGKISDLQLEVLALDEEKTRHLEEVSNLKHSLEESKATIIRRDTCIRSQQAILEAKIEALKAKGAIISDMSREVTKAAEYLINKKQVLLTSFTWRSTCAELPDAAKLTGGKSVVFMGKVYCEGEKISMSKNRSEGEYIVYCYDPSQDMWTTLPPLPVRNFGLGQVNGKLVAVGGQKGNISSAKVHTYDNEQWSEETISSMPTARSLPSVLSLQSALVVAGGFNPIGRYLIYMNYDYFCNVEIFKPDTLQWCMTNALPTACCNMSLVAIGNTCYALGGQGAFGACLNQALYASVDDLLGNAVPANQTTSRRGSSDTQSAWKTLLNTPTNDPTAAVLAGNLLAAGGDKKENLMYLYSFETKSWVYIGSLPYDSKEFNSIISLSSLDILVIANGGNSVYKGTPAILKSN